MSKFDIVSAGIPFDKIAARHETTSVAPAKLVEGYKADEDKPPFDLIPPLALEAEAKVLGYGRRKYAAWNWAKGITTGRLIAAALRHIYQYLRGEDLDPESELPHLAHASCMIHFALEQQLRGEKYAAYDDRFKWEEK